MQVTTATREPRTDSGTGLEIPSVGALVAVRGRKWVVGDVDRADAGTCVTLQSVEDGEYGRTLDVIWEVEPGRRVLPSGSLPDVTGDGFDPPERLAAFLDAVRWSAVTSADVKTLQAPFRSGVAIEDYQLEPVSRAVGAPRVNLLLADDVGLGKTIEADLVAAGGSAATRGAGPPTGQGAWRSPGRGPGPRRPVRRRPARRRPAQQAGPDAWAARAWGQPPRRSVTTRRRRCTCTGRSRRPAPSAGPAPAGVDPQPTPRPSFRRGRGWG